MLILGFYRLGCKFVLFGYWVRSKYYLDPTCLFNLDYYRKLHIVLVNSAAVWVGFPVKLSYFLADTEQFLYNLNVCSYSSKLCPRLSQE